MLKTENIIYSIRIFGKCYEHMFVNTIYTILFVPPLNLTLKYHERNGANLKTPQRPLLAQWIIDLGKRSSFKNVRKY